MLHNEIESVKYEIKKVFLFKYNEACHSTESIFRTDRLYSQCFS